MVEKGRLGPGQMIAVDTQQRVLLRNDEIKDAIAHKRPYRQWVQRQLLPLDRHLEARPADAMPGPPLDLKRLLPVFNYTQEEMQFILKPMAGEGKEPVGSMGDDTALAVLSTTPRLLSAYFKQKFAQVTNPPIDPIREELVMSLDTYLGRRRSLLEETELHARLVHLTSPLMIDTPSPSSACSTCRAARTAWSRRCTASATRPSPRSTAARPSSSSVTAAWTSGARRCRCCWPWAPSTIT